MATSIWLVTMAMAAAYVVVCVVVIARRIGYPYELEWLEGVSVEEVRRILSGQPLYAKPSIAFTPLLYTPAYFYISAAIGRIAGVGFVPLRIVSSAASAVTVILAARLVWRETKRTDAALVAAGLYCAMFGWTDGWFDLARTDALFLALAFAAVYLLRWRHSAGAAALAGVLIGLSYLAKQTGLVLAVPLGLWCVFLGRKPVVTFLVALALTAGGTSVVLDVMSHGWFRFYVFTVPGGHAIAREALAGFWRHDLFGLLPVASVAALWHVIMTLRRDAPRMALFYGLVGAGFVGAAWVSRMHSLGYVNVLLPAYLIVAVVAGLAFGSWMRGLEAGQRRAWTMSVVCLLAAAQFVRLSYDPRSFVPTAEDVAAGDSMRAAIARTSGDVWTPAHGGWPSTDGRPEFAHVAAIADILRAGRGPERDALAAEVDATLAAHRFAAVIAPAANPLVEAWLPLSQDYRPAGLVVEHSSRFWRRETLFLPRE